MYDHQSHMTRIRSMNFTMACGVTWDDNDSWHMPSATKILMAKNVDVNSSAGN